MNRAIITGATGPIGIELCKLLLSKGWEVTALVRPGSPKKQNIPAGINIVEVDLKSLGELGTFGYSADVFFHLGWSTETRDTVADPIPQADNIVHTIAAVQLAKRAGCEVFVGAGSWVEHGDVKEIITPDLPADPLSAYGIAKYAAGKLSRILCGYYGIRHCWARILSVYGPYDKDTAVWTMFIKALLKDENIALTKGEQRWDFIYSADCAKALYLMALRGKDGAIYPVGTGFNPPIRYLFEIAKNLIAPGKQLVFGERPYSKNQVMLLSSDNTALGKDTGFYLDYTFEQGIQKTIEHIRGE